MPANKEHTEATPSSLAVAAGEYLDYLAVERGLARNTIAAYRRADDVLRVSGAGGHHVF